MMPRPFHRRVSFWLGLFVACFLAWECLANRGKVMVASFPGRGGDQVHIVRVRGNSYLVWGVTIGIGNFVSKWVTFARFKDNGYDWEGGWQARREAGARYLKLPDAVVFLAYLWLWVGWMAWRGRRVKRLATASAEPEAGGI